MCGATEPVTGVGVTLTTCALPAFVEEKARVEAAGGCVLRNRVCGRLALSRALGDYELKTPLDIPLSERMVIATPDITEHTITEDTEFVVLACDGIWDVMTSAEVVHYVRTRVANQEVRVSVCGSGMQRLHPLECS